MHILNESFEMVPLNRLRTYPRNPRRGDVAAIERSIARNGFYGAVVAQKSTGLILAGNHRYLAAQRAGAQSVPVLWVDVDDGVATRILLADNRTSDLADYDDERLAELLAEVVGQCRSLDGTGYRLADLERLLAETTAPPPSPAPDQSGELEARFQILVDCRDEDEQTALLVRLAAEGHSCRALVG